MDIDRRRNLVDLIRVCTKMRQLGIGDVGRVLGKHLQEHEIWMSFLGSCHDQNLLMPIVTVLAEKYLQYMCQFELAHRCIVRGLIGAGAEE